MRALTSVVATLALASLSSPSVGAFAPASLSRGPVPLRASGNDSEECTSRPCDVPSEVGEAATPSLANTPNGATALRSAVVTNAAGDFVRLDDALRSSGADPDAPHVLVYLRHMGWPYCWSYAKEWCSIQQELEEAGIGGPIFVSIGDSDKLNSFLDANPFIPREQMFVDDYSFDAYKAAGFGRFDQVDKEVAKNTKLTAPELGFGEWITYFTNVGKISPVPKDMKFGEFPEGVLWTGGTFVIQGDEVLYQWSDTVPGNHPVVEDVVKIAKDAPKNKKGNGFFDKMSWL